MIDTKEYARQMRENCVKNEAGNIVCSPELWEQIASIIENAIVPPCELGDTLYWLEEDFRTFELFVNSRKVQWFHVNETGVYVHINSFIVFSKDDIGKFAFFSLEEAEQALKERKNNENA